MTGIDYTGALSAQNQSLECKEQKKKKVCQKDPALSYDKSLQHAKTEHKINNNHRALLGTASKTRSVVTTRKIKFTDHFKCVIHVHGNNQSLKIYIYKMKRDGQSLKQQFSLAEAVPAL